MARHQLQWCSLAVLRFHGTRAWQPQKTCFLIHRAVYMRTKAAWCTCRSVSIGSVMHELGLLGRVTMGRMPSLHIMKASEHPCGPTNGPFLAMQPFACVADETKPV